MLPPSSSYHSRMLSLPPTSPWAAFLPSNASLENEVSEGGQYLDLMGFEKEESRFHVFSKKQGISSSTVGLRHCSTQLAEPENGTATLKSNLALSNKTEEKQVLRHSHSIPRFICQKPSAYVHQATSSGMFIKAMN